MKVRRAMAVAAATAAISPFALLSAPAAFAEGSSASPTPTESVTETPSGTASDTATATPSTTTLPTGTTSAGAAPTSSAPTGSATPSASASESGRPEPSEPAEPSEAPDVPFCEEVDEEFSDAKVSADVKGLPGKIVAGDGFHGFKLIVTNESDTDVEDLGFYAEVENFELDESKYLSPHVDLEFKNPESGSWERIGDSEWAGDLFFGVETLKSKASQTLDLRVSIGAKAPAGDAYSFGSGAYLDNVDGQDCIAQGWDQADFEVLKAGSANPDPGTATPGDNGGKGPGKKPQGNISDLPTGNLADTGASSALPAIGLVSGVAIVAGAGAVFAMRRRKAGVTG
ncbi:cell wall protein [Streptomyces sp. GESEQ-4]|uniref:cell wall protein n=1 Tax=Streptomyces sp. GESEQ-4 TaxID=2812655 RepID=UPI001B327B47|nr:cell wall protein [Streptomyces sp. GESEQ-4]